MDNICPGKFLPFISGARKTIKQATGNALQTVHSMIANFLSLDQGKVGIIKLRRKGSGNVWGN